MEIRTYLLLAATAALTACSMNDIAVENVPVTAQVSAGISTRAAGTSWDKGDAIGISTEAGTQTSYTNMRYVTAGTGTFSYEGEGNNGILFKIKNETVTFNAYYPYDGHDGELPEAIEENTGDQTRQAEYDFLFADGATAGLDNPDLRFEGGACFDHMMSRLVLNITADPSTGISSDDLRDGNYMISGIRHWGFFDPATGTASADQTRQPDNMWRISATPADNGSIRTYTLILFPQNASLTFHAEIGGKEYSCDFQLKLEPSVSYTYGITLKSDSSAGTPGNSRRFSRTNAATEAAGSLEAVQPF